MKSISNVIGNILISLIILHIINVKCFSQSKSEKIDSLMKEYYKKDLFNGSILVTEHREIIYNKSFGYSNIKTKEELSDSSIFNLASLAKQFTATAIMILYERNELSYKDKLVKYIPELKPIANGITIRHLLNHTSGLPEYLEENICYPEITNQAVIDFVKHSEKLVFEPGEQYSYCNTGYVMLATIIERISKQTYHQFLEENIFKPLLMKNTFVYEINKRGTKNVVNGYKEDKNIDKYETFTFGDGNIYSTLQDMFKWEQSLYTEKLVKAATLDEAFKKSKLSNGDEVNYGYGWNISESNKVIYHRGGWAGANTSITRYTHNQNAIIILSNFTPTNNNNMFIIESAIEDILANKPISSPQFGR